MEWSSAALARDITQNIKPAGIDSFKQQQRTREKERGKKRDLAPREQNRAAMCGEFLAHQTSAGEPNSSMMGALPAFTNLP